MTDSKNIVFLVAQDLDKPLIRVEAGHLPDIADKAEAAIIEANRPIYRRGTVLVRPVVEEVDAAHGRKATVAVLHEVGPVYLRDLMGRVAAWEKFNIRKKGYVKADPPAEVAGMILARYGEWSFSPIAGIIATPTLRPDGSIFSEPGYDPDSRFYLADPPELPPIPKKPARDNALTALADLTGLLEEFPFVDEPSRAVALSALITPIARGAFVCAPMHVARAPTPASGKSYLFDVAAAIAFGEPCPVMAAGRDEAETEKRLGAALLSGQSMISLDNVDGELGGVCLCQVVERPMVDIRILGKSEKVRIEARGTTFFATGNNIVIVGDMTRRAIVATLDPQTERPELREFKGDPVSTVLADRGRYIAAALTICRAYAVAGYPDSAPPMASFGGWSKTVRSALMWLGCGDATETMEASRAEDPDLTALREILQAWDAAFGTGPGKQRAVAEVLKTIEETDGGPEHPDLREAVLAGVPFRGRLTSRAFGKWLSRNQGRIANGLKFMRGAGNTHDPARWWVAAHTPKPAQDGR